MKQETTPVEFVGSRLGDHFDGHPGVETLLGVLIGLDAKLFDQLGRRSGFVAQPLMPVDAALMAVGVVSDGVPLRSVVAHTVDRPLVPIPGGLEDHSGQGIDQHHGLPDEEAHVDWKDFKHFRVLGVSHGGVGCLDQCRLTRDGDRFRHVADLEHDVHRPSRVRGDSLSGHDLGLESGQAARDLIFADPEGLDQVVAAVVAHRHSLDAGGHVARGHLHTRDHAARCVGDGPLDVPGALLGALRLSRSTEMEAEDQYQ